MNESGGAAKIRIENEERFRVWLENTSKDRRIPIAVVLAARIALRALPMVAAEIPLRGGKERQRSFAALTVTVFRASALAWVATKNSTRTNSLRADPVMARAAYAAAAAAATDAARAARASDLRAAAAAGAARAAAAAARSARAAYAAAYATATAATDDDARAAAAVDAATRTARAAIYVDAAIYADSVAARAAVWAALSADVDALARGDQPETLAGRALWLEQTPAILSEDWRRLRGALPSDDNWDIWLGWYENVLAGRSRGEDYELVFASVPEAEWDKGPAAANAWIKAHLPDERPMPKALDNVPSAFTFGWNASARISIIAGPQNQPVFPYAPNQADHATQLAACRSLAQRLVDDLKASRLNCSRPDYREVLQRYLADLPSGPDMGNLVLADAEYRILRDLFAAEAGILSAPFASRLRIWTQQHIGLRTFYPEVERFYDTVKSGRLERPLPEDAVAGFEQVVREYTPRCFEPEVSAGLREVEREPPQITIAPEDIAAHESAPIQPQPDPWGELEPRKSRSFSIGGAINGLWKVFLKGKDVKEAKDGWGEVADKLRPHASSILEWLQDFINKNGS